MNPAKIDFNDELNALAHTRLELNAVPEQLALFCCVKNSAQEKLSKMTIMSKNSVFRELCVLPVLAFKEYFFYHQLKYRVARHEVDLQAATEFGVLRGLVLLGDKLLGHISVKDLDGLQLSCGFLQKCDAP